MSLIRKHGAVLQAWACLDLVQDTMSPLTQHVISQQHKESQAEHKPAVI